MRASYNNKNRNNNNNNNIREHLEYCHIPAAALAQSCEPGQALQTSTAFPGIPYPGHNHHHHHHHRHHHHYEDHRNHIISIIKIGNTSKTDVAPKAMGGIGMGWDGRYSGGVRYR